MYSLLTEHPHAEFAEVFMLILSLITYAFSLQTRVGSIREWDEPDQNLLHPSYIQLVKDTSTAVNSALREFFPNVAESWDVTKL